MRRPTLAELRRWILLDLDDNWRTPTYFQQELGLGHGTEWLQVALVLERLVNDGIAELQRPGARVRRFRRRRS